MSVLPSDIVLYGSANMPEADNVLVGGAIDFTKRADFYDVTPNGTIDIISSNSVDTGVKATYAVRDPTGVIQTVPSVLFNGTTAVTGGQTAERLLYAAITGGAIGPITNPGGTAPLGDCAVYAHTPVIAGHTLQAAANPVGTTPTLLTLQAGDGTGVSIGQIVRVISGTAQGANTMRKIIATSGYGTDVVAVSGSYGGGTGTPNSASVYSVLQGMLFERGPNSVLAITRLFATAAADVPGGSTRTFYEKVFVVNNNTATSLTPQSGSAGVAIQITGESPALSGGVLLDMGPDSTFNGTTVAGNRQATPTLASGSNVVFTTQPQNVFAPGAGNLVAGAAPNSANSLALWLRLTVPAGASPYKGAATIQTLGNTT